MSEVAPVLDFFGDLAAVHSTPVTQVFDSSGGSLALADGATVEVPAGAFGESTELNVVIIDLLFEKYADNAPSGRIYMLSTEAEVDLGVPVVLEVPKPSDSVTVTELVGGEARLVNVASGPTTRIEIAHFSDQIRMEMDRPTGEPVLKGDNPQGVAATNLLHACVIRTVVSITRNDTSQIPWAAQFAYGVCARALVNVLRAPGEEVELGCVGGKIGGDIDLQAAIDACIKEQNADAAASDPDQSEANADSGDEQESVQPAPGSSVSSLVGSFGEFPFLADFEGRPLSEILENEFTVDLSGDTPTVTGVYRYLGPTDHYARDSEVTCKFEGIIEVAPAPLGDAAFDGETWTGTLDLLGSFADGTCPAGDVDTEGNPGSGTLSFRIVDSGVSGELDVGGGLIWPIIFQPIG